MSIGDISLIAFLVLIPLGFVIWAKGKTRIYWVGCILGMYAVLGGCEAWCKLVDSDHRTLSQRFGDIPMFEAVMIVSFAIIGWLSLWVVHLLGRQIKKWWEQRKS